MEKLELTIQIPVIEESMKDLCVENTELLQSIRIADHQVLDGVVICRENIDELLNHTYFLLDGHSSEITNISLIEEGV